MKHSWQQTVWLILQQQRENKDCGFGRSDLLWTDDVSWLKTNTRDFYLSGSARRLKPLWSLFQIQNIFRVLELIRLCIWLSDASERRPPLLFYITDSPFEILMSWSNRFVVSSNERFGMLGILRCKSKNIVMGTFLSPNTFLNVMHDRRRAWEENPPIWFLSASRIKTQPDIFSCHFIDPQTFFKFPSQRGLRPVWSHLHVSSACRPAGGSTCTHCCSLLQSFSSWDLVFFSLIRLNYLVLSLKNIYISATITLIWGCTALI